jgi:hypothetical protein
MAKKKRTCGGFGDILRKIDKFAEPVQLTIDGNPKIQTVRGGICTVIVTIGVGIYVLLFVLMSQVEKINQITTTYNTRTEHFESQKATFI